MPRPVPSPIKFVESPFFKRRAVITTFKLPACQNARHDVSGPIPLSATQLEELRGNSSFRAIVYCGETHSSGHLGTNVKFPTQLEMRVNDQDVKANFKGVGKKEGSVKPVDITPFIRKQHGLNYFKLTYALTSKVWDRSNSDKKRCHGKCSTSAEVVFLLSISLPHLRIILTKFIAIPCCNYVGRKAICREPC
jgi:hypothetical protein